jgi:hypothetical protein
LPLRGVNSRLLPRFVLSLRPRDGEEAEGVAPDGKPAILTLAIPAGLAISFAIHFAFLTPVVIFGAKPFDTVPTGSITVDIVSADQLRQDPSQAPEQDRQQEPVKDPKTEQPTTPASDASTPSAPSQAAASAPPAVPASPSQPQPPPGAIPATPQSQAGPAAAAAPPAGRNASLSAWLPPPSFAPAEPAPPQPPQDSDVASMFAMPLTLPDGQLGGKFDPLAVDRAVIDNDTVAAFREHLKKCSLPPAGIPAEVKVVLRVYLKPDGSLVAGLPQNPEPIKVEGASGGVALFQAAVAAMRRCQPYGMLPPEHYEEWKRLDITFTPQNF